MKQSEIERLLPYVIRRTLRPGGPLSALLAAMDEMHAPSEKVLAELPRYFDPRATEEEFVPFLARWVDLDWLLEREITTSTGAALAGRGRALRDLIAQAWYLNRWRGTERGLVRFLELATGMTGFRIWDKVKGEDGRLLPFHIRVRAPVAATRYEAVIRGIVEREKPAHVTFHLEFIDP